MHVLAYESTFRGTVTDHTDGLVTWYVVHLQLMHIFLRRHSIQRCKLEEQTLVMDSYRASKHSVKYHLMSI